MKKINRLCTQLFIASLISINADVLAQTPDSTLVKVGNYTLAETPPTGYNKYLYKGNIVLKPGFISVAGKEQKFGPNVEITDQVNSGYTIGYNYDNLGNVIEQTVVDDSSSNTVLSYTYEYDNTSRLSKVFTKSKSETSYKEEANYSYNNDDNIGSALFSGGEQVSYTYDANVGWLTAISAMNGSTSRFSQSLAYLNNGNVSSQTIYNSLLTNPTSVTSYTYDNQNRLTASTRSGNSESYTYNKDGAFTKKKRNTDSLDYNYKYYKISQSDSVLIHKLQNVAMNSIPQSMSYDSKGNIIYDGTNGAQLQDYTYFNLPLQITKNSVVTNYAYNNAGSRIYKTNVSTEEYYLYDYTGKVLLVKNKKTPTKSMANVYGNGLIGKIENVFGTAPDRYYYIKDHLGSTRMVIQKHATSNEAVLAYDYSPYGEIIPNQLVGIRDQKYLFTEKENDTESEYDYFGARYYNSKLGIWLQVDPLAEKYPGWSPYNYTLANPINYLDPNGTEGDWTRDDLYESLKNGAEGFDAVKQGFREKNYSWDTPHEAALAAAQTYGKTDWQNREREWGAYILYNKKIGKYGFSDFSEGKLDVSGKEMWKEGNEIENDYKYFAKQGLTIVGLWHQHPNDNGFSWDDVKLSIDTGLKVYATFRDIGVGYFDRERYLYLERKNNNSDAYESMRKSTILIYEKKTINSFKN